MTTVTVNRKGGNYDIRIKGHAGFNPGNDIVCSAASILTFTLLQSIANTDCEIEEIRHTDGEAVLKFYAKKQLRNDVNIIVDVALTGFKMLENRYPEFVKIFLQG